MGNQFTFMKRSFTMATNDSTNTALRSRVLSAMPHTAHNQATALERLTGPLRWIARNNGLRGSVPDTFVVTDASGQLVEISANVLAEHPALSRMTEDDQESVRHSAARCPNPPSSNQCGGLATCAI